MTPGRNRYKWLVFLTTFAIQTWMVPIAQAHESPAVHTPLYPILILDFKDNPYIPYNFRTMTAAPTHLTGLHELRASGSAQFSATNFPALLKAINHPNIVIVDLRKESHGLLDGLPISWYGVHNAANKGKSPKEVINIEKNLLNCLNQRACLNGKDSITAYISEKNEEPGIFFPQHIPFNRSATTEQNFVINAGYKTIRFYVLDETGPDDIQLDRFVKFVKMLPANTWLHFHCHDGQGRTTTFLALYDMIRNAKHVSLKDILNRQEEMNGENLLETNPDEHWRAAQYKERLAILEEFYRYARDPNGYERTSWLSWQHKKRLTITKLGRTRVNITSLAENLAQQN